MIVAVIVIVVVAGPLIVAAVPERGHGYGVDHDNVHGHGSVHGA